MPTLKKLLFGPLFLISLASLIYQLKGNLNSYDVIFSLSVTTLIQLLTLSALISLSSLLFVLFASLASSWKIVLPIGIIASTLPIILVRDASGFVLCIGIAISMAITYLTLTNQLKTYLNFEPASLFGPSIRHMVALLIIVFSFIYFLSINKVIAENGFQLPESLIDSALKFVPSDSASSEGSLSSISPEQLALSQDLIKQTLQTQIQAMIKPYLSLVPAILAVLFFIILQSLTSITNLLVYPMLWITFYAFKKTKFITFKEEQRTVRKMVI